MVIVKAAFNVNLQDPTQVKNYIYNTVLPACEQKGVYLSRDGNHNGPGGLVNNNKYLEGKQAQTLFSIERICSTCLALPTLVTQASQYKEYSYGLKHNVEKSEPKEYLSNGDLIVAMLLSGYDARFGKGNSKDVNCDFKAKWIGPNVMKYRF